MYQIMTAMEARAIINDLRVSFKSKMFTFGFGATSWRRKRHVICGTVGWGALAVAGHPTRWPQIADRTGLGVSGVRRGFKMSC